MVGSFDNCLIDSKKEGLGDRQNKKNTLGEGGRVKEKLNRKRGEKQDLPVEVEGVGGNQCIPLFSLALDVFTFNPPLFIPL